MSYSSSPPSSVAQSSHDSAMDSLKPSVITIMLILFITVLISVSLCLLLRHIGRCCPFLNLSASSSAPSDSRRISSRRVSPEVAASSFVDSLPLFTFSSVRRRSASAPSTVSGDCAVCLSKFESQDQLRLLPLCCHAFHAQCIDTWLVSNQTCPLCRSPLYTSDSDLMKALLGSSTSSSAAGSCNSSFRLEIGSISRRQAAPPDDAEHGRSYSIGSFRYVVEDESEVVASGVSTSGKEEEEEQQQQQRRWRLAQDVGSGSRSWLKEYVDRLSHTLSFRSSERSFTGGGEADIEANHAGEEISEMFRWLAGV